VKEKKNTYAGGGTDWTGRIAMCKTPSMMMIIIKRVRPCTKDKHRSVNPNFRNNIKLKNVMKLFQLCVRRQK
jgi:hypothetical protein